MVKEIFPCSPLGMKNPNGSCECFLERFEWDGSRCVCRNGLHGILCNTEVCTLQGLKLCKEYNNDFKPCGERYDTIFIHTIPQCNCLAMNYSDVDRRINQLCSLKPPLTKTAPKTIWTNNIYGDDKPANGIGVWSDFSIAISTIAPAVVVLLVCLSVICIRRKSQKTTIGQSNTTTPTTADTNILSESVPFINNRLDPVLPDVKTFDALAPKGANITDFPESSHLADSTPRCQPQDITSGSLLLTLGNESPQILPQHVKKS